MKEKEFESQYLISEINWCRIKPVKSKIKIHVSVKMYEIVLVEVFMYKT